MPNQLRIPFGDLEIIAEINADENELVVYIAEDGLATQDIALIRPQDISGPEIESNSIEALVWGDCNDEDYTDQFIIDRYEEEGE